MRFRYRNCFSQQGNLTKHTQKDVFGLPLTAKELEGIKQVVDCDDGLTEEAFLYLQLLFVQKGNMDTTWTVLRRYGYQETDGRVTRVDSQP